MHFTELPTEQGPLLCSYPPSLTSHAPPSPLLCELLFSCQLPSVFLWQPQPPASLPVPLAFLSSHLLPLQVGFTGKLLTGWSSSNFPEKTTAEERELGGRAARWVSSGRGSHEGTETPGSGVHAESWARRLTAVWSQVHSAWGAKRGVEGNLQTCRDGSPRASTAAGHHSGPGEGVPAWLLWHRSEQARTEAAAHRGNYPKYPHYEGMCLWT